MLLTSPSTRLAARSPDALRQDTPKTARISHEPDLLVLKKMQPRVWLLAHGGCKLRFWCRWALACCLTGVRLRLGQAVLIAPIAIGSARDAFADRRRGCGRRLHLAVRAYAQFAALRRVGIQLAVFVAPVAGCGVNDTCTVVPLLCETLGSQSRVKPRTPARGVAPLRVRVLFTVLVAPRTRRRVHDAFARGGLTGLWRRARRD